MGSRHQQQQEQPHQQPQQQDQPHKQPQLQSQPEEQQPELLSPIRTARPTQPPLSPQQPPLPRTASPAPAPSIKLHQQQEPQALLLPKASPPTAKQPPAAVEEGRPSHQGAASIPSLAELLARAQKQIGVQRASSAPAPQRPRSRQHKRASSAAGAHALSPVGVGIGGFRCFFGGRGG